MMYTSPKFILDKPTEKMIYNPNLTISSTQKKFYMKQEEDYPVKRQTNQNQLSAFERKNFENQVKKTFKQRILRKTGFPDSSHDYSTLPSFRTDQFNTTTHMAFIAAPDELLNKSLGKDYLNLKSFTPFSTILQNNQSWHSFAKKNQDEKNTREVMQNQLKFNKSQQNFLVDKAQKDYSQNFDTLLDSYRQRQQRFNLPKIRIKNSQELLNIQAKQGNQNAIGLDGLPIPQNQLDDEDDPFNAQIKEQNEKKLSNIRFYWYSITDDSWRPEIREYPTLTFIDGKLYLYGGMGLDLFNTLCYLDFHTWKWNNLQNAAQLFEGRYGHSAHQYKKDLLIFGGEKKYNSHLKMRQCFNDIQIYDIKNNVWNQIRTFGDIIENRRNHASVIISKFIFIFGGINNYNKHLYDFVTVNLETFKCHILQVESIDQRGIAFHQMTPVFRGEAKIENPYYTVEIKKTKEKKFRKIKEEGLYIFGGLFQNGEATNQLRVVKLGQKPLKLYAPDVKGIPPLPRYQHSQHYYEELNILVIYGGRNDNTKSFRSVSVSQNGIMGDICILDLESLNWINVEENGLKNLQKCAFSSCMIGSKIIVFGGYQEKGFVNADLYLLELDQQKNRKLIRENNPLVSGPQKNCISVFEVLNNNTDLFDITDDLSKQKKKNAKALEISSQVDITENEATKILGLRTYQPLPQSILKNRNSSGRSFLLNLQNSEQPKFKHNDMGIPSLCSVSEESDDQETKQVLEFELKVPSKKNTKSVSYAKL